MRRPLKTLDSYSRSTVPTTIYFSALVAATSPLHNSIFYTMSIFFVSEEIAPTFWCLEKKYVFQKPQNFHISANFHAKLNMAYSTSGYPYFMFFCRYGQSGSGIKLKHRNKKGTKKVMVPP